MPAKNNPKNTTFSKELEKRVAPVLVMNNSQLKPYIELFEQYPENIYQQPLGSLVGFFEIKDYSEDSAYIVNFLTSVLKKEYYANPKRSVAESFDSALHKINVALSELAKHKNVNWLGNLDGAVCVMEKNSIHFSVTGNAHLFIYRNQFLTDISEELAPNGAQPHPLKTFVDVSSGRIEENDKVLLFSDDLFHVLPLAQLKKNLQRFSQEDFVQFLKTALTNELEMTAVLVVDVLVPQQPTAKNVSASKKPSAPFNAFSEKTYSKQHPKLSDEFVARITQPEEPVKKEYTDKKTGHIYVQGEGEENASSRFGLFMDIAKEHLADVSFHAKNISKKRFLATKKGLAQALQAGKNSLSETIENAKEKAHQKAVLRAIEKEAAAKQHQEVETIRKAEQTQQEERLRRERMEQAAAMETQTVQEELPKETVAPKEVEPLHSPSLAEKIRLARLEMEADSQPQPEETPEEISETSKSDMEKRIERIMGVSGSAKIKETPVADNTLSQPYQPLDEDESAVRQYIENAFAAFKRLWNSFSANVKKQEIGKKTAGAIIPLAKKITASAPHISKIQSLFARLTTKQKTVAIGILVLIIVAPIAIGKLTAPKKQIPVAAPPVPTLSQKLAGDKNITLLAETKSLASEADFVSVVSYGNVPYAVAPQKITTLANGSPKEYPFPNGSGNAVASALMSDLKLIFILTDQNKLISFSPISRQFSTNTLTIPSSAQPKFIATYLTYLYMPDNAANQIYRYPRATGGFGNKTDWYKDTLSLSNITDMTIDDSVYFVINNKIVKLFKGKNQNAVFEDSQTPINFDRIYTNIDSQSLYVLDAKNARLVQYDKTGNIQNQYFNENLLHATALNVDEQNKTAYIVTPSGLLSLAL